MVDVILSPEVDAFLERLPQPERRMTRGRLRKLSDPQSLITRTRPLLGAAPEWRVVTVGPFEATCRLLREDEAQASGARHPALEVATIDRTDDLRMEGERQIEEAENGETG